MSETENKWRMEEVGRETIEGQIARIIDMAHPRSIKLIPMLLSYWSSNIDCFKINQGIDIKPIYTADDVKPSAHSELPGKYPYTRGYSYLIIF